MSYFNELDDARPEVRKAVSGQTIITYARIDGVGLAEASSSPGDCQATVYDSNGSIVSAATNVSPTADPNGLNSKFVITIPSFSEFQEDAFVVLEWLAVGETIKRVSTIYFDVVLQPWGPSSVSVNDLLQVRPDIGLVIDQQATRIGGGLDREKLASIYGSRAHTELYHWVRSQISADASSRVDDFASITRPNLIIDKSAIHRIETLLALALVYEGDMTSPDSAESDAAGLHMHYKERARSAFMGLGPMRYDSNSDRVVDVVKPSFGRAIRLRRVQG
tara:strand:- start:1016 stop:1846 length:831 start_codon:yes stop_codon:yes gene_type:complete